MEPVYFDSAIQLRQWLEDNHAVAPELWLGIYRKESPHKGIGYKEAVDELLCFGWIDGIRKRYDEHSFITRITPRKRDSIWSQVNILRAEELVAMGRMHPAGIEVYRNRNEAKANLYSYEQEEQPEFSEDMLTAFKAEPAAWAFFQAQPAYYRRLATHWVVRAKQDKTRQKRLVTLISDSKAGSRLG